MERITMTVKETAAYIGVHSDTLRAMVREDKIPHVRVRARILFRKDTLEAWMSQQEHIDGEYVPQARVSGLNGNILLQLRDILNDRFPDWSQVDE